MADATPSAPAVTSTPAAPATTGPAKIVLTTPGAPAVPPPKAEAPATAEGSAGDASEHVKAIAKASAAERKANALVADLKKQLEASTGSATQAQQDAALLAEVKKNPRKLLEMGLTWDQILDSVSGTKEEAPDPRHEATQAELKKLQERLDAKEKAEKDAKEASEKEAHTKQYDAALENVAKHVETQSSVTDDDGFPRWAIVSSSPEFHRQALAGW